MTVDLSEMTVPEQCEHIRACISPLDLLEQLDDVEVHNGKIRSPHNPGERTPSCHIYEDGWFDFSTGKGGDVIDLYQALTGASLGRALNTLGRWVDAGDLDPDRVRKFQPAEPPDLTETYMSIAPYSAPLGPVWAPRLKPLRPDTIDELSRLWVMVGSADTLYVGHHHQGGVTGIKIRSANGAKSAVPGSTFAAGLYWPFEAMLHRTLVITEGESDCWALLEDGRLAADVAALPSGAGLWKDAWLPSLDRYDTIYTAFDNDRAGEQATEKVRKSIGWGRWKELKVPTLFNDVREAMAAGWEPKL